MVTRNPVLVLKDICKEFPGVKALNNVSLELYLGEVHALLGENGAGKSTLMKIISGIIEPDSGEMYLDGRKVQFKSPKEAMEAGIALVHQELSLVPSLSVGENIFLGRWPQGRWGVNWSYVYREARELMRKFDIDVDPRVPVRNLGVAEQQIVEIQKAVSQPHVKILLLDEPTSALTEHEVERLFKLLNDIKAEGKAIVFISHKIDEALKISDRVTIIKDGEKVITEEKGNLTEKDVIYYMTGRAFESNVSSHNVDPGRKAVLSVRGLSAGILKGVDLDVYAGEILVIFGILGSGRSTLARVLFGLQEYRGEVFVEGERVEIRSPLDAIRCGIGYLPEDRRKALVFQLSVGANITLASLREISRKGLLMFDKEKELAERFIDELRIRTSNSRKRVTHLSGGNQQKVLFARWLAKSPKILILDEPTRGIDVGAKFEIREIVKNIAKEGKAVLYITSEALEALEVGDRIAIMRGGKITKILPNDRRLSKSDLLAEVGGVVKV